MIGSLCDLEMSIEINASMYGRFPPPSNEWMKSLDPNVPVFIDK